MLSWRFKVNKSFVSRIDASGVKSKEEGGVWRSHNPTKQEMDKLLLCLMIWNLDCPMSLLTELRPWRKEINFIF